MIKKKSKVFFLTFLLVTTPFIQFIQTNVTELSFYYIDVIRLYVLIILPFFIVIFFFYKKNHIFLYSSILFFLIFQFKNINFYLNENLSLIIIFILFFLIIFFLKKIYFEKFLIFFLSFNILFTSIYFLYNSFKSTNLIINKQKIEDVSLPIHNNLYVIIVDDMISINDFEEIYSINLNEEFDKFKLLNSKYISGTYLNSNGTTENITNILKLSEINYNLKQFKFRFKNLNYLMSNTQISPLLKHLEDNKYDFKFIGSSFIDCYFFNNKFCINEHKISFINFYVIDNFLKATPYIFFRKYLKNELKKKNKFDYLSSRYKKLYKHNDAIDRLLKFKSIEKSEKKTFYLVHHLSPHDPHFFNSDCSFRNKILETNWSLEQDYKEGYKLAYICTLKKIHSLLKYVKEKEPESIVIIQGDSVTNSEITEYYFGTTSAIKYLGDYYKDSKVSIFSLLTTINNCKDQNFEYMSNIEVIKKFLTCNAKKNN